MDQSQIKNCTQVLRKYQFQPIKRLGKGAFGIVFLVQEINTLQYFSIKCTDKMLFNKKPQLKKYMKQEIEVMKSLNHPNIVRLYDAFQDSNWIFMIMEYCNEGNLAKIQSQRPNKVFQIQQCRQIIGQIISGLSYMHNYGIIHRDIKLQNILRTRCRGILSTRLCDFGFSRQTQQKASTYCGTSFYMAPQIFQKKNYDKKVDIWALGVAIFLMIFGSLPFKSINMQLEIKKKCQYGFQLSKCILKKNSSLTTKNINMLSFLFKSIFQLDPKKRISLQEISSQIFKTQLKQLSIRKFQSLQTTDTQRDQPIIELEQVYYIKRVIQDVERQKFLTYSQFLRLKYYLDKVCLSILVCERDLSSLSLKQMQCIQVLRESQKQDYKQICEDYKEQIKNKIRINKTSLIFKQYKKEYRMIVGQAFSKAHQQIKNSLVRTRIKLKLVCCHLINRVFQKQYRNSIFQHYYRWKLRNSQQGTFNMYFFKKWIQEQEEQKISKTIQLINSKFFKKQTNI